jgi:hypothetical protein
MRCCVGCRGEKDLAGVGFMSNSFHFFKYLVLDGAINTTIQIAGLQADQSVRALTG